jgi:hypothetical protein
VRGRTDRKIEEMVEGLCKHDHGKGDAQRALGAAHSVTADPRPLS